jgi:hypothetical protein
MKKFIYLLILAIYFTSCESNSNHKIVVHESQKILNIYSNEDFAVIDITKKSYPSIWSLSPNKVTVRKDGLYIKLEDQFSSEKGFFVPRDNLSIGDFHSSGDPSYKLVQSRLFEYEFK